MSSLNVPTDDPEDAAHNAAFVREAEAALAERQDLTETEAYQLQARVEMIQSGETSLSEAETVDEWLDRLRDHYP